MSFFSANLMEDARKLMAGEHADPFSFLGTHACCDGFVIRAFLPGAHQVALLDARSKKVCLDLIKVADTAVFTTPILTYRLRAPYSFWVDWGEHEQEIHDPYRFPFILSNEDLAQLSAGTHLRPYEVLGAHMVEMENVEGVRFAVWAPNAKRVSVVGDFNHWDGRRHVMRHRREAGIWEIFLPHVVAGDRYKFEIKTQENTILLKADPYATYAEMRPDTASKVTPTLPKRFPREARRLANSTCAPISIYEVHLGSWRLPDEETPRWFTYRELAYVLLPYVKDLGFTHVELLPISTHPFDESWGYQPTGLYAPTARFGTPEDFAYFVAQAHEIGIGVIVDWVGGHFPEDAHGLSLFDGTPLYEHADPREGYHPDWNVLIYNYGSREVCNYLLGNALYWLEYFGVDGLRVDAVASMIYRDYSREPGEWIPNEHGGRENLEAISFLQQLNEIVHQECPHAITIAEESTQFPHVTKEKSGLGFDYKWNLGWMNDTLDYLKAPLHARKAHHENMTFGMMYAFTEQFMLPLSHDEVVHGKSSLLGRMPGDEWQRFANLRAYYGFMWGYPGKMLLFMGGEIGQYSEWDAKGSVDWHLLRYAVHRGVQHVVRDLNRVYQSHPPLYEIDFDEAGFMWLSHDDRENAVFAFVRKDAEDNQIIVISHFKEMPCYRYRLGVPKSGRYEEIMNTDHVIYGGSGVENSPVLAEDVMAHGQPWSIELTLPPLATIMLKVSGVA